MLYHNMSQTQNQVVPETILEQLRMSRVHGFSFFSYTGIKAYNLEGEDTLYLKEIPRNPKGITGIQIVYDYGWDSYKMAFFKSNQRTIPTKEFKDIYFDQLAEIIVNEMGVN